VIIIRNIFSRAGWLCLSILTVFVLAACMSPITPVASETAIPHEVPKKPNISSRFQGHAQHNDVRFEQLSVEQGLSQSSVFSIVQDRSGFLWFGTQDGLNRYDGYHFSLFQHDPDDPTSLSSNNIRTLFVDKSGTLWIGTDQGLNQFDDQTGQFERIPERSSNFGQLSGSEIDAIGMGENGIVWVGTDGGVDAIDLVNNKTGHFAFVGYPAGYSNLTG